MDIEQIKLLVQKGNIIWRGHMLVRMQQRNVPLRDIINCVTYGELIEDYPSDFPYPSCLILGRTLDNRALHVVCAVGEDHVWMITAYSPNLDEWCDDYKCRRKKR